MNKLLDYALLSYSLDVKESRHSKWLTNVDSFFAIDFLILTGKSLSQCVDDADLTIRIHDDCP